MSSGTSPLWISVMDEYGETESSPGSCLARTTMSDPAPTPPPTSSLPLSFSGRFTFGLPT